MHTTQNRYRTINFFIPFSKLQNFESQENRNYKALEKQDHCQMYIFVFYSLVNSMCFEGLHLDLLSIFLPIK